jgi:hypothetical protein
VWQGVTTVREWNKPTERNNMERLIGGLIILVVILGSVISVKVWQKNHEPVTVTQKVVVMETNYVSMAPVAELVRVVSNGTVKVKIANITIK